jgi:putative ABC transport system permease protein
VTFVEPRSHRAIADLEHYPGVLATEPIRVVPVTFRKGWRTHRGAINGMPAAASLVRILDAHRRPLALPADGLVLSDKLARVLDVHAGESVIAEVREGSRPVRNLTVVGTLHDYVGTAAYMERTALARLLRESPKVSGAHVVVDPRLEFAFFTRLKGTPAVASVFTRRAMRDNIRATVARTMMISLSFLVLLAGIIAFGVVYNTARIALSERAWELATLRVIGLTRREVAVILLAETTLLVLLALPLGLITGYIEATLVSAAYDSEQFRIPVSFRRSSYGFAAVIVTTAALLSGAVVWRLIGRLDLIGVLKTRE